MPVFVSHSFKDKAAFENVINDLDGARVPYWNPSEVRPGASLREQLRAAVNHCEACIFVATRESVASSWCGSELGAFWGAGKPIVVYLADTSLSEKDLPSILQGDVWEPVIRKITLRAKELLSTASREAASQPRHSSVAQLTVEELQRLIAGAVSLAAAASKDQGQAQPQSFKTVEAAASSVAGQVLAGFQATASLGETRHADWGNKILWVDDRPQNNVYERQALEAMGFEFTLALSTSQAMSLLREQRFAAIISDMGRKEGPREGYVLLEAVRASDSRTPFFIYAGSRAPEHQREAALRGAQGSTNIARELIELVVGAVRPER